MSKRPWNRSRMTASSSWSCCTMSWTTKKNRSKTFRPLWKRRTTRWVVCLSVYVLVACGSYLSIFLFLPSLFFLLLIFHFFFFSHSLPFFPLPFQHPITTLTIPISFHPSPFPSLLALSRVCTRCQGCCFEPCFNVIGRGLVPSRAHWPHVGPRCEDRTVQGEAVSPQGRWRRGTFTLGEGSRIELSKSERGISTSAKTRRDDGPLEWPPYILSLSLSLSSLSLSRSPNSSSSSSSSSSSPLYFALYGLQFCKLSYFSFLIFPPSPILSTTPVCHHQRLVVFFNTLTRDHQCLFSFSFSPCISCNFVRRVQYIQVLLIIIWFSFFHFLFFLSIFVFPVGGSDKGERSKATGATTRNKQRNVKELL